MALRDYQINALKKMKDGTWRPLPNMGKTDIFSAMAKEAGYKVIDLSDYGFSIDKAWREGAQKVINKRTESITRLWKFFSFPVDYIESVLDFYRGDLLLAFEYLNDQERGKTMEAPRCSDNFLTPMI